MERLPENPGSVVQSTVQRDMQKEQGSAQSDGKQETECLHNAASPEHEQQE